MCLLFCSNIFLIFLARASPNPGILERSFDDADNAFNGEPNFSNIRIAVFSPTPGRLDNTDNCCFCKSFDFLIFFNNGPLIDSFLELRESNSFAVCEALGVGIIES